MYGPDLSGAVMISLQNFVAPYHVLIVSLFRSSAVDTWVGTHYMCPAVVCLVTECMAATTLSPIYSMLVAAPSLPSVYIVSSIVSLDSTLLESRLQCGSIFQLHGLHHCLHLLQLSRYLLLRVLYSVFHICYLWFMHGHGSFDWCWFLLQDFLESYHHIKHYVHVVHAPISSSDT